jgi:predicted nucleic-acid-binding protein
MHYDQNRGGFMPKLSITSRSQVTFRHDEIATAIEALIDSGNVQTNRIAVHAGLAVLRAGGDFADGVIAYEGTRLGGETFVSFDKQAVSLVAAQGQRAQLLA